jgi:hypothetical protein
VALGGIQSCGFSVKDDLAHITTIPTLGRARPAACAGPERGPDGALRCRPGRVSCVRWQSAYRRAG